MQQDKKSQQDLVKYEKEKMEQQNNVDKFKEQGRVPDQQNRLKDTENMRK